MSDVACDASSATLVSIRVFCDFGLGFLGRGGFEQPALDLRHPLGGAIAAHEDRLHAVVLFLRDRVVLVRVALGALEGEPERGRRDDLHRVFERLIVISRRVLDVLEVGPAGVGGAAQIAGGDERVDLRRERAGSECGMRGGNRSASSPANLELEEAVVGHVGVERADDEVAISPGGGAFVVGVENAFGVGVAGEVEPVPAPSFAVMRRGQQRVDEALPGVGAPVGEEGFGLLGRRGKAPEVEIDATDEA